MDLLVRKVMCVVIDIKAQCGLLHHSLNGLEWSGTGVRVNTHTHIDTLHRHTHKLALEASNDLPEKIK